MGEGGFDKAWWKKAALGLLVGLLTIGMFSSCARGGKESFTGVDALVLCDNAIKSVSINSSLVDIPFQQARETPEVFGFLWTKEDGLKMPNAFGAQVDTVVICRVGKDSKRVEHLEVNGEVLSSR